MIPTLHTERLTLRPITANDMADLYAIYSDPRAMRFMPSSPHASVEETQHRIGGNLSAPGAVNWAICLRGEDKVIGRVNYLGQTRIPGMGYILHPDYWGRGFTAEACRAALDYGFAHLGYDRVELWIDETNVQSIRVAQKLGFGMKGRLALKYPHEKQHHFSQVWGMLAADWRDDASPSAHTRFFSVEPVLMVYDVQATAHFYRDVLGFNLDFLYGDPPTHGGVSRGEWNGALVSLQLSQVPEGRSIEPAAYLHIRVDASLDALYTQYRAAGVEMVEPPGDRPWGFREFTIKDSNGHMLRFATFV